MLFDVVELWPKRKCNGALVCIFPVRHWREFAVYSVGWNFFVDLSLEDSYQVPPRNLSHGDGILLVCFMCMYEMYFQLVLKHFYTASHCDIWILIFFKFPWNKFPFIFYLLKFHKIKGFRRESTGMYRGAFQWCFFMEKKSLCCILCYNMTTFATVLNKSIIPVLGIHL